MVFKRILFNFNFIFQTIIAIKPKIQDFFRDADFMGRRSKPIFPIFQNSSIPIGAKIIGQGSQKGNFSVKNTKFPKFGLKVYIISIIRRLR